MSTGNEGWTEFLRAYNAFAVVRGGKPLFNQTPEITPAQARAAFGERLTVFEEHRKRFDPEGRLLNDYFSKLLS